MLPGVISDRSFTDRRWCSANFQCPKLTLCSTSTAQVSFKKWPTPTCTVFMVVLLRCTLVCSEGYQMIHTRLVVRIKFLTKNKLCRKVAGAENVRPGINLPDTHSTTTGNSDCEAKGVKKRTQLLFP